MKYDGIVIFSDLDGTLLDEDRKLSKENMDAISRFVQQGGSFGIATGRTEKALTFNFPDLNVNAPSIFFNGALACDANCERVLFNYTIPDSYEAIIKRILAKYPKVGCEINLRKKAYVFNLNDNLRTQIKREGLEWEESAWEDIPGGWIKVLFADRRETLKEIKADLEQLNNDINVVFSEYDLLDIMAKGVSKGAALDKLKSIYKESWRFTVAVGDNHNDLELIQAADLGIAVDNAVPAVKDASAITIENHNTPCIPQVLDILETYL
ncbi:MAG: HAD family hydrolase [Clostridiaceae bacterium]|nr:HAD family hydrolase [Clostridiaceae bacterium]